MSLERRPVFAANLSLGQIRDSQYDVALAALGYEARSSYVAGLVTSRVKYALPFDDAAALSQAKNKRVLLAAGFDILEIQESNIVDWLRAILLREGSGGKNKLRVCVDISSLTRRRLAYFIESIVSIARFEVPILEVDFVYNVAQFTAPTKQPSAATVCGPVSPFLAGWPTDPEKPVAAIVGLGYEYDKALGAFEYLEPSCRLLLAPVSVDARYDAAVQAANRSLLESHEDEVFRYPVDAPMECLELLDALFYRLGDEFRIVALPFGPKIFALCCMLLSCIHYPRIGVWRISDQNAGVLQNRYSSENTVGLRVQFAHMSAALRR